MPRPRTFNRNYYDPLCPKGSTLPPPTLPQN
jgi:hypothetical protein